MNTSELIDAIADWDAPAWARRDMQAALGSVMSKMAADRIVDDEFYRLFPEEKRRDRPQIPEPFVDYP